MKRLKAFALVLTGTAMAYHAAGQANASISVLTLNSGIVETGGTVNIQVTVGNTGPSSSIGVYKVRTQLSVPSAIASILPNAQQTGLPTGWTITSNNGSTINLSNGTDIIPVGVQRNILIAVQGNTLGGPSTVSGQLSFSNGNAPGTAPGSLAGDNTADNNSQSSLTVTPPVPVTLADFNATLLNCTPVLNWTTEIEINSDKFVIERSADNGSNWTMSGSIPARGFTTTKSTYRFTDQNTGTTTGRILYRLKMIDRDGSFRYSPVLPVSLNCNTPKLNVFPNPVKENRVYISLTGTQGQTEAVLLNAAGQVVAKRILSNGTNPLDLSGVANGMYILQVNNAAGNQRYEKVKLVVQH